MCLTAELALRDAVKSRISAVFDKWEMAVEEGRKNDQPLNDNVVFLVKKDIVEALEGVFNA